jgi:hypothetical protein
VSLRLVALIQSNSNGNQTCRVTVLCLDEEGALVTVMIGIDPHKGRTRRSRLRQASGALSELRV